MSLHSRNEKKIYQYIELYFKAKTGEHRLKISRLITGLLEYLDWFTVQNIDAKLICQFEADRSHDLASEHS